MNTDEIIKTITDFLTNKGLHVLGAIAILIIGKMIARGLAKVSRKAMEKSGSDRTLLTFVENLVYIGIMVFVILGALGVLGVPTASMVAAIGACGLAVGLAMQGALSNFAAGFLIIFFRPFKVEDLVEVAGEVGIVREIELFTTKVTTLDNKTVIIPNAQLTSGKIVNFTETDNLRIDLVFGISYSDNIDSVKEILYGLMKDDKRVLQDPAPFVGVVEHGESSINLVCRPWVNAENYWGVYFDMHENVKKAFDEKGVSIPFPQRDVHMIPVKEA